MNRSPPYWIGRKKTKSPILETPRARYESLISYTERRTTMNFKPIEEKHRVSTLCQRWSNDVLAKKEAEEVKNADKSGRNARNIVSSMPALLHAMKRSGEEIKLECGAMDREPYVDFDSEEPVIYDCLHRLRNRDSISSCCSCRFYDDAAPMRLPSMETVDKVMADVSAEKRELEELFRKYRRCLIQKGLAGVDNFYCDAAGMNYAGVRMEEIEFFAPATVREERWIKRERFRPVDLNSFIRFVPVAEEEFQKAKLDLYRHLSTM